MLLCNAWTSPTRATRWRLFSSEIKGYEISLDRKKTMIAKGDDFYILDSDVKSSALGDPKVMSKAAINLSHWTIDTIPRDEYRGIFLDAWRLERDYFYDRNMHGVNWLAMRDRYLPLVDRVADRDELNNVIAQMVSELSALHTFVQGGDARKPSDEVDIATLGAVLRRDEKAGGYVVGHVYLHDPDLPNEAPPLARPESRVNEGEVILSIDGQSLLGGSLTNVHCFAAKPASKSCYMSNPSPVMPATCL